MTASFDARLAACRDALAAAQGSGPESAAPAHVAGGGGRARGRRAHHPRDRRRRRRSRAGAGARRARRARTTRSPAADARRRTRSRLDGTQLELGALRPDTALACIDAALPAAGAGGSPGAAVAARGGAAGVARAARGKGRRRWPPTRCAVSHARRPPPLTARRRLGRPAAGPGRERLRSGRPGPDPGRGGDAKGAPCGRRMSTALAVRSASADDPEVAAAGRRLPAGRGDVSVRLGRRLVVGSRHHLRPPGADVRGALRRLVSRRARRAALQAAVQRGRPAPRVLPGRGARAARRRRARAALREQIRALRVESRRAARRRRACWRAPAHARRAARRGTDVLAALACNDLTLPELLHGRSSFDLLTTIAERVAPDAPFLDLFWHYRAIFAPVLRLLGAPTVPARCYHAVATGYAGLLAALWSHRTGRPLMVTEHGIYARERDMELARADWIRDEAGGVSEPRSTWAPRISPLRRLWSSFFRALSRMAYVQARHIITLSDVNRSKQIADGAPPRRSRSCPTASPCTAARVRRRGRDARRRRDRRRDRVAARGACASASSGAWCRSRISSPSSAPATSRSASSTWTCA